MLDPINPTNPSSDSWMISHVSERFHCFAYDDLEKRDKANLDIFWLKDDSLEGSANLPDPDVIAREIMEDLQAALEQFAAIAEDVGEATARP